MKKLINKLKNQPIPVKLLIITGLTWIYPFIEGIIYDVRGWNDLSIVASILCVIGMIPLAYAFIFLFLVPIGGWCLMKLGLIKDKKKK
jgi:hypothetical protein